MQVLLRGKQSNGCTKTKHHVTMTWTYPDDLPLEDSSDLSEEEAASAIPTQSTEAVALHVRCCPVCAGPFAKVQHAFRLRDQRPYWRVAGTCGAGHDTTFLFFCPWLMESGANNV